MSSAAGIRPSVRRSGAPVPSAACRKMAVGMTRVEENANAAPVRRPIRGPNQGADVPVVTLVSTDRFRSQVQMSCCPSLTSSAIDRPSGDRRGVRARRRRSVRNELPRRAPTRSTPGSVPRRLFCPARKRALGNVELRGSYIGREENVLEDLHGLAGHGESGGVERDGPNILRANEQQMAACRVRS